VAQIIHGLDAVRVTKPSHGVHHIDLELKHC